MSHRLSGKKDVTIKRKICGLTIFALVVLGVGPGCQRAPSVKREPVALNTEKDLIGGGIDDDAELLKRITPRKKFKLDVGEKIPDEAYGSHADIEWAGVKENDTIHAKALEVMKAQFEKVKDAKDQKKHVDEIVELGSAYAAFCGKTPVVQRSFSNFKADLRRNNKKALSKMAQDNVIEVIMDAEPEVGTHVIGIYASEEKAGNVFITMNQKFGIAKRELLNDLVTKQKLTIAFKAMHAYLAKTPAGKRNYDQFKAYIKDNALPSLTENIESNAIWMVDPSRLAHPWVACDSRIEGKLGYRAVTHGGIMGYVPEQNVSAMFVKDTGPPPKM